MRTAHTDRSKFDRALAALEDLAVALRLSDRERVEIEKRLLESSERERRRLLPA